jgi:hypothetical protein
MTQALYAHMNNKRKKKEFMLSPTSGLWGLDVSLTPSQTGWDQSVALLLETV